MEMSIFLSLAFTEILHLKNTLGLQFLNETLLFEHLHFLEPSMWQYLFLINSKHHKTACPHSHIQTEGKCFILRSKTVFIPTI